MPFVAREIRNKIIEVVGKNGGHLASNLGVVELTIALHRVFDSPNDAIVFDVSHQCYAHKILTGRYNQIDTLRLHDGLSGFTRRKESVHDFFDNGHSSTSIGQALGLLTAWQLNGKKNKAIAVIGDGALTGGMAFEALGHAGQLGKNLIVVLNDNQMSISPNTGALSRYLSSLSITSSYQHFKSFIERVFTNSDNSKTRIGHFIDKIKLGIKGMFINSNIFTDLGFEYVGPLNGHSISSLEKVFKRVKKLKRPVVIHIRTKKGRGYAPAENDPALFHGIGPFQISDGKVEKKSNLTFTQAFSTALIDIASKNPKICAITAAMSKGTGLENFAKKFPKRFFDVGIAEQHAITFASGLSCGGMIPVVAIYSTFIQRAIDQIIHDVALSDFKVVICLDRAGIVPGDGSTHQGLFDISLIRSIPNVTILCPESDQSLKLCLEYSIECSGPVIIRYPKLCCPTELKSFSLALEKGRGILLKNSEIILSLTQKNQKINSDVLFVCTGGMYNEVLQATNALYGEGVFADIYCLRFIKPLDENYFVEIAKNYKVVVNVEDGVETGGIAQYLSFVLARENSGFTGKVCTKAFPDEFLSHGNRNEICSDCKMTARDIAIEALELLKR